MENNIKKLLIVEDNPADARLLKEYLKDAEENFVLTYAIDLLTCLDCLKNNNIDAILLDLSLPDAVKLEAIDKIMKVNDKLPIIIITGLSDKEAAVQALSMGAQDYIIKGQFDTNLLLRSINYAIERKITENKLIENTEQIRQSEEKYRALFENSLDGIYRTTIEGYYIDANMALVRMLGYDSKEELFNKNVKNDIYISDKDRPGPNKRDQLFESHLKKKDGNEVIVEISPRVIYKDGKPEYYEGIVRNITQKKKAEGELKRKTADLTDRIKESRLLYDISNISITHGIGFEDVLKKAIDIIPNGFQYPKIICIRITCNSNEYKSGNFRETNNKITTKIQINSINIGKLEIYYLKDKVNDLAPRFLREEKELIEIIAQRLGETYHRIFAEENLDISYAKLKKTLSQTINALASIVETKDPYTSGHQKNVARIAVEIAKELKLPEEKIEALNIAALVHDIGKINVPASILSKPGKLTEIELMMIKEHSRTGFHNINGIDFGYPVAEIVLQHHERLNGSGYPDGLREKDISLEAKILTVADVAEAMTAHRPYRVALGREKAIEELKTNSGSLYDKKVVDAFLSLSLDIEKIKDGHHICAFFDNTKTQLSYIVPFIIGGLKSNKKCLYMLDESTQESLETAFINIGYDIIKALKSKQLVFYTKIETYIKDKYFEPEKIINFLKEAEKKALAEGYSGLRVISEMNAAQTDFNDLEKLIDYENLLNNFIQASRVSTICQYNELFFNENVLIDVLLTHPLLIINGLIYKNNCFLAPNKFSITARDIFKKKGLEIIKNEITKKILV